MNFMKIAQVAPLAETVPPSGYGGTERVCSWLTEALVADGHEVTLFASGASTTAARLIPGCSGTLRGAGPGEYTAALAKMLDHVRQLSDEFDLIHFHADLAQFQAFQDLAGKSLTTLHGRLDDPGAIQMMRAFKDAPLVSISDAQRRPVPDANWVGTIPHGMPAELISLSVRGGDYLAFLGRMSPEKRPDRAIEIAIRAGMPLKLAAKVDKVDEAYFNTIVKPLLDPPMIEFVGEIGDRAKAEFLGGAAALLFPIDWPEPFGLVMIEAMAAGTPIIAWPKGAASEVVEPSLTGFLVRNIDEAVEAVALAASLDRALVRNRFEQRFTVERMMHDYVALYAGLERTRRTELPRSNSKTERSNSKPELASQAPDVVACG
jgi:glycosyltransferase involved in cell wall biosynthesis